MKISAIVIAHNEAEHIAKCIDSLLVQSVPIDEIVVVAHNCSDQTATIAKSYGKSVHIVELQGAAGTIRARIAGIERVSGDIILCIDGDSYAQSSWAAIMTTVLLPNVAIVGSWVRIIGQPCSFISNAFNRFACAHCSISARLWWLWGASMAFRSDRKERVLAILKQSIELSQRLELSRSCDDCFLALFLQKEGEIVITNKTYVTTNSKEKSLSAFLFRHSENRKNGRKIRKFFASPASSV